MEEKLNKAEKLAREVLFMSRDTLLVNLRFLNLAISQLELNVNGFIPFGTDGKYLHYSPMHVITCFKNSKEQVTRDYLHALLHCIYRHMFVSATIDRDVWDVACDIAVENVITHLDIPSVHCSRENEQKKIVDGLKNKGILLTAEKIYSYLKGVGMSDEELYSMREVFFADHHEIWYADEEKQSNSGNDGDDQQSDNGEGSQSDGNGQDGGSSTSSPGAGEASAKELIENWKKVAERMQTDVMMFSNGRYGDAGSLIQNLKEVNREKYDYTSFLKKFAVMGEAMKINDDEFDYIFYTYGLKLYDKMPLIEPLEYKEVKRIKEFVIAIDTSGSVVGSLVQQFVQKTYNILKSTESFFSKMNLHIIQCDTAIQEHVKITTQEEFDRYLDTMTLKGFGGNNEVELFRYVDELVKNKEFTNLKGMIYLTDGYGIFPNKKPDYNVAFVFVNDRYEIPEVPPWVIRLVLEPDDIKN